MDDGVLIVLDNVVRHVTEGKTCVARGQWNM